MDPDTQIQSLRAALAVTPDNAPLRRHLAEVLTAFCRHAEAEVELKALLKADARDHASKLMLAKCYRAQGKNSAAHVVLDDLVTHGVVRARIELARLTLAEGDVPAAVRHFQVALDEDPTLYDEELGARLGVAAPGSAAANDDEVFEGRLRAGEGSAGGGGQLLPTRSDIKFVHVGGLHELKDEIRKKIVLPLQRPDLYEAYGKKVGGGILMYGPPGCGKTFLAKATAGEVDANFLAVGIHEVLEMWIGQSERNLHGIFEAARQHRPCVLFFDEVDALGASRADIKHGAGRQTINQFLAELDGLQSDNEGLLVLAATNAPWHMDSAFRRPGRFDRVIFVPPPDVEARAEILRLLLADKPTKDIDYDGLAKKTDRYSGADLKAVVDRAIESKLDDAMASGVPEPLTSRDLMAAVKVQRPSTSEWFATAKNYVLYANEAGLYDDLKGYLRL